MRVVSLGRGARQAGVRCLDKSLCCLSPLNLLLITLIADVKFGFLGVRVGYP